MKKRFAKIVPIIFFLVCIIGEMNAKVKLFGKVVDEDEIQKAIEDKASKTLVSICIAPNISQSGSYCYKMLLSTDTNELYYYRKQKISGRTPRGFLIEDMKKIAVPFSN